MPKAKDARADKAFEMYKRGLMLKEIAIQLDVAEGTVRSWKNRYKWDGESNATLRKKEKQECNVAKKEKIVNKAVADEVIAVTRNTELTDKQQLFCVYYIRCFNATKAYQKAYGADYTTAVVNGPRLLGNARVKEEILRLKQERLNREFLSEEDIFQKYMDIAFADITDFTEFGNKDIEVLNETTGEREKFTISYVNVKDSSNVDGTLISEISKGKDGVKVKLADRMKALQWLSDHMDLATAEQRARIAVLTAKVETDDEGEDVDDGFIEALNSSAREDWSDEEEN